MSACNFLYPPLHPSCKANFKGKTGIAFLYSESFCFFSRTSGRNPYLHVFSSYQAPGQELMFVCVPKWPKGNSRNYFLSSSGQELESLSCWTRRDLPTQFTPLLLNTIWGDGIDLWLIGKSVDFGLRYTRLVSDFTISTFLKLTVSHLNSEPQCSHLYSWNNNVVLWTAKQFAHQCEMKMRNLC